MQADVSRAQTKPCRTRTRDSLRLQQEVEGKGVRVAFLASFPPSEPSGLSYEVKIHPLQKNCKALD